YGGRLSSVVDIRLKDGNKESFGGEGSVGLLSSRLLLEGPIVKDKSSFIISGRRTYADIMMKPFARLESNNEDFGYYFYDLTTKLNYKFNDKHRLYLSAYMGNDKAYEKYKYTEGQYYSQDNFDLQWGNIIAALRWNYMINSKMFSNTSVNFTRYKFITGYDSEYKDNQGTSSYKFDYFSGIDDWVVKTDFDFIPNPNHYVRFGANYTYHTFNPGVNAYKESTDNQNNIDTTFGNKKLFTNEAFVYIEDDITFGKFKLNAGMHVSGFKVRQKFYYNFEPRISMRYLIKKNWSVKAAYSQMAQYVHLLSNSNIGLPTDLWLPVTDSIGPQQSTQYAIGSMFTFGKAWELSLEGFYKEMNNLIGYKEGASFLLANDDWEKKIEIGKGWSYGMEVLLRKTVGKTTGWIGYTLSWSERQFDNISFGERFPYKYDRRHDISVVFAHKFSDKVDVGASWVFGSGYAVTLATEKYATTTGLHGDYSSVYEVQYFPHRNSFRMPNYHKLDFNINFHKEKKWGTRTWSVGMYNMYNRQNPFFLYYSYEYNNTGNSKTVLKQASLFPMIPFVSYSFKF
ncbi:MAG: TonB-dependent receptor, partial [Bacteroidales bacterium]|nr:TonB-dependent receptor [Bacteroidales bacterium]